MARHAVRGRPARTARGEDRTRGGKRKHVTDWTMWDRWTPGEGWREGEPESRHLNEEERARKSEGLELIASENLVPPPVLEAMVSPLNNKYAEGLPGK